MNGPSLQECEDLDYSWFNTNSSIYDESDLLYEVPPGLVVFLSICYGTISVLAIVGNLLVMWIIAKSRQMHNFTNYLIANLALADIIIGLFSIPFQFQAALLQRWNLPHFMCAFCPFIQALIVSVSIFTLTAIAIDRFRAILKPLSVKPSKLAGKLIIAGIWIFGVGLAMPMAMALRVTMVPEFTNDGKIHCKPFCDNINFSPAAMKNYRTLLGILQYLIPLLIISYAYIRIGLKLWGNKTPGNAEDTRDANLMKNKKRVIKMLFVVVALFGICWLPLQAYNVLQYSYPEINEYRYINIIWFCCDWLAMSNSCYNPFIYGIYNEKFKKEFRQRNPFKSLKWFTSQRGPPIEITDVNKSYIRPLIRCDWNRETFGNCSALASLYRGVPIKEQPHSSKDKYDEEIHNKNREKCCARKNRNNQSAASKSSNSWSQELYVFPSRKQALAKDLTIKESGL